VESRAKRACAATFPKGDLAEDWDWWPTYLLNIASDIAQPGWAEPRDDLIEFALVYLEADVMLFRSGYTKRHLIKRLQQSPLSKRHVARIDALLRRAVCDGTGVEEFRAYRKIAAHLVLEDRLPDLEDWLEEQADGAILTLDRADGALLADLRSRLSEELRALVWKTRLFGRSRWGVVYPQLSEVVPAGKQIEESAQRVKFNAYLMLSFIDRRRSSEMRSV